MYFYPRSPCGERRSSRRWKGKKQLISIHALLAESDRGYARMELLEPNISIHALLAESDTQQYRDWRRADISIHALLAESDLVTVVPSFAVLTFLSTLSLRRATDQQHSKLCCRQNFYPRSPCGERRRCDSHSARTIVFLSTLSLRRATYLCMYVHNLAHISIHALLAESDCSLTW